MVCYSSLSSRSTLCELLIQVSHLQVNSIANDDGHLSWRGQGGAGGSCRNVCALSRFLSIFKPPFFFNAKVSDWLLTHFSKQFEVQGNILHCQCLNRDQNLVDAEIDLDEGDRIQNLDVRFLHPLLLLYALLLVPYESYMLIWSVLLFAGQFAM